ncbi:glucosyltransferase domain-containing protein [Dyella flagellata]|uniref:Glucosyl transferase GtrII n=1 Tax=Dyella flagellata TaxID=1867833 RepID=A0ABQ5XFX3_9GAMM|nr:glucosyltransferase domain-containing protein [Dyella flagellata]GLQ90595.1 hypothetical protein GCM10007898_41710 [Dyella flagellata]
MPSSQQIPAGSKQLFGILFTGYLLFVLYPILRADRPFNDDMARMLSGAYSWNDNGRPLTTALMRLLEGNLPRLVDFAPMPQILAIALLALAGMLIARRYAIQSPWLAALLVLPLGAQPFFLENLSFRFDAVAMGASVLLAVLPVSVCRDNLRGFALGALALLGCLCSYQPCLNVFLIFVLLDLVAAQARDETPARVARLAAFYVGEALLAVLIYQWKVAPSIKDWIHEHSQMIHSPQQWDVVVANAKNMSAFLLHALARRWTPVLVWLLALTALAPVAVGLSYAFASSAKRTRPVWVKCGLALFPLLLPFVALACVAGPMLLLVSPILSPRVFPGVGALMCASLIALHVALRKWGPGWGNGLCYTVAGVWTLGMFCFANIYGNASTAQKQYETQIASQLANDLAELKQKQGINSFLMDGSAGLSPLSAHAAEIFPVLNNLIPPYLMGNDFQSRHFVKLFGTGLDEARENPAGNAAADALLLRACDAPVLYTRNRYVLRVVDTTAVVTFPGGRPLSCPHG